MLQTATIEWISTSQDQRDWKAHQVFQSELESTLSLTSCLSPVLCQKSASVFLLSYSYCPTASNMWRYLQMDEDRETITKLFHSNYYVGEIIYS